jgi:hypothetical protein
MYYKEQWVDNKLMFKSALDEEWKEFTKEMYAERVREREEEILSLTYDLKTLEDNIFYGN